MMYWLIKKSSLRKENLFINVFFCQNKENSHFLIAVIWSIHSNNCIKGVILLNKTLQNN